MSRPLHVALLGPANSIHLQRWAIGLAARGLRVSVITQHGKQALGYPPPIELSVLPWRGLAGYLLNAWSLRRTLKRLAPDLLHVHYASGYGSTAMLARWHPVLLSVWGADVYEFPYQGALKRKLLLRNLRFADRLASTSQAMAAQVRRLWPALEAIDITPFGVDTDRFKPAIPPQRPLVIGTVKTLSPKYGIDVLLRAFARLVGTGLPADVTLLIVGDGPQSAELQALARQLGVGERVTFAGAVPHTEVPLWLGRMDVYVAVSRDDSESFGVAVIEASACGLPVVVSDAGGLPEVVEHGATGLIVLRDDPAALADALASLVASPELRSRLGSSGRTRVVQRYDWPRCVETMIDCYHRLLRDAAATAPR